MNNEEIPVGCAKPINPIEEVRETTYKNNSININREVNKMIRVGKKAPDFVSQAYNKGKFENFKLSDHLSKWVVLCFYPGDFTFVWATELSAVAAKYPEFQKLGAEVFSMSVDTIFVHKMWNEHELSKMVDGGVPFPMLSDAGGKVGSLYGIYDEDAGINTRGRFIIDPDGIVQGFEVLTPPVGRNVMETIRQIQAFQYVRNSKGTEALPSGWKPGKMTLKLGPELVGKVWEKWQTDMAFD